MQIILVRLGVRDYRRFRARDGRVLISCASASCSVPQVLTSPPTTFASSIVRDYYQFSTFRIAIPSLEKLSIGIHK